MCYLYLLIYFLLWLLVLSLCFYSLNFSFKSGFGWLFLFGSCVYRLLRVIQSWSWKVNGQPLFPRWWCSKHYEVGTGVGGHVQGGSGDRQWRFPELHGTPFFWNGILAMRNTNTWGVKSRAFVVSMIMWPKEQKEHKNRSPMTRSQHPQPPW